jgi:hypothetical protein
MTQPEPQSVEVPTEPLYSAEDVARALHSSGDRALAQAWFTTNDKVGLTKAEADDLIQQIETGQAPGAQALQLGEPQVAEPQQAAQPAEEAEGGA